MACSDCANCGRHVSLRLQCPAPVGSQAREQGAIRISSIAFRLPGSEHGAAAADAPDVTGRVAAGTEDSIIMVCSVATAVVAWPRRGVKQGFRCFVRVLMRQLCQSLATLSRRTLPSDRQHGRGRHFRAAARLRTLDDDDEDDVAGLPDDEEDEDEDDQEAGPPRDDDDEDAEALATILPPSRGEQRRLSKLAQSWSESETRCCKSACSASHRVEPSDGMGH